MAIIRAYALSITLNLRRDRAAVERTEGATVRQALHRPAQRSRATPLPQAPRPKGEAVSGEQSAKPERFRVESVDDGYDTYWRIVDATTGEEVGSDRAEPEDKILIRDFDWMPRKLNELARALEAGEARAEEADERANAIALEHERVAGEMDKAWAAFNTEANAHQETLKNQRETAALGVQFREERDEWKARAAELERHASDYRASEARARHAEVERDALAGQLQVLREALDRDQTGLAAALNKIITHVKGFSWLLEGRGSYEWDDDRYREEAGHAIRPVIKLATEALAASGTIANSALASTSATATEYLSRVKAEARREALEEAKVGPWLVHQCVGPRPDGTYGPRDDEYNVVLGLVPPFEHFGRGSYTKAEAEAHAMRLNAERALATPQEPTK